MDVVLSHRTRLLLLAAAAVVATATPACGDDGGETSTSSTTTATGAGGGSSTAATGTSSSSSSSTGGGSATCPTATLSGPFPIVYNGSTVGKPNLMESQRMEFEEAGDDALLFVAPVAGTYEVSIDEPVTNGGCAVAALDWDTNVPYDSSICPTPPNIAQIDAGAFAYYDPNGAGNGTITLAAGQEFLMWVSCAYWSIPTTENPYTLTITQQ